MLTRIGFVQTEKGEKMRLIDADKLRLSYWVSPTSTVSTAGQYYFYSQDEVDNAPTIEAEPVVRCKDCRWGREACGNIECSVDCNLPPEYHGYEWFCPNGESRTEVEE